MGERFGSGSAIKDSLRASTLMGGGAASAVGADDFSQYVHIFNARTITAQHTFSPVAPGTPFVLGANAQGQLVTGLFADQLNKSVIAGNGLTGGGLLSGNVTLNVAVGDGLSIAADSISLTTPGTLSHSSPNSAATNHTHAVTYSSNPGGAPSLLGSAGDGGLQLLRFGLGVDPDTDNRITVVNGGQIGLTAGPLLTFSSGDRLTLEGAKLRIAYNGSNYADLQTDSGGTLVVTPTGNLTLQPVGDITLNPSGNDVMPYQGYKTNLGSLPKKYLTLNAAELWVETLVAHDTMATFGGRILVGPTTTLVTDLSSGASNSDMFRVKHNSLVAGNSVYMEASGKVEFFDIVGPVFVPDSGADAFRYAIGDFSANYPVGGAVYASLDGGAYSTYTVESVSWSGGNLFVSLVGIYAPDHTSLTVRYAVPTAGEYAYHITRNLDGSGRNNWYAGDAVFDTTTGFIDIYSIRGVKSAYGPAIVGNVRNSTIYNDWIEHWAIGNLNGVYGYGTNTYGAAFGKYANGQSFLTADATNGIRMRTRSGGADTTVAQWAINGTITIGDTATGKGNIAIAAGALAVKLGATERIGMTAAGLLTINDYNGSAVFTFDASAGAEFTKPLTIGANGGIYQGTGTFASPTTGLKIWNDSGVGRIGGYNAGTIQWYADTDGSLCAGGGAVKLSSTGFSIAIGDGTSESIRFMNGTTETFRIRATSYPSQFQIYDSVAAKYIWLRNNASPNALQTDFDVYIGNYGTATKNLHAYDVHAYGKLVTYGDDVYSRNMDLGLQAQFDTGITFTEHFNGSMPGGLSWAAGVFVTPTNSISVSRLVVSGLSGGQRSFLSGIPVGSRYVKCAISGSGTGTYVGLRLDDGTDNNYVETRLRNAGTASNASWYIDTVSRVGGGAVTTTSSPAYTPAEMVLRSAIEGTPYTNWSVRSMMRPVGGYAQAWLNSAAGLTWTPTRCGLVFSSQATWEQLFVDAYA